MARFKRSDDFVERDRLLNAIGECRRTAIQSTLRVQINGPLYKATHQLTAAIDDLAGLLTGDREHFHMHGQSFISRLPMQDKSRDGE